MARPGRVNVQSETDDVAASSRPGGGATSSCHACPARDLPMDALIASTALVAFAEIGDKTMLLAILLATRFRQPAPIITGILVATLFNHALAAWAGSAVAGLLDGQAFRIAIGLGFVAMGIWTLVPDKLDDDGAPAPPASARS